MRRIIVLLVFSKQFAKLSAEIGARASVAACDIEESADHASLGVRKKIVYSIQGCPKCVIFAYEINRSYRILYCVGKDCLTFISVGDHKAVYGND